jgi:hypothetical protein
MVAIRCPWCDKRLEAADGDILSAALALHFHREHRLVLSDPRLVTGGRAGELSTLAEIEGTMGEDEERQAAAIYGAEMAEREDNLYGVEGPPRTIYVQHQPHQWSVECPFCGYEAAGKDEDELTRSLRDHMRRNNELEEVR